MWLRVPAPDSTKDRKKTLSATAHSVLSRIVIIIIMVKVESENGKIRTLHVPATATHMWEEVLKQV